MASASNAEFLEDLAATSALSRPPTSNDNPSSEPYSETVMYRVDHPGRSPNSMKPVSGCDCSPACDGQTHTAHAWAATTQLMFTSATPPRRRPADSPSSVLPTSQLGSFRHCARPAPTEARTNQLTAQTSSSNLPASGSGRSARVPFA